MKTACIQLGAGEDKKKNIQKAEAFVNQAIGHKAKFIVLPEVFVFRGRFNSAAVKAHVAEKLPGESLRGLMALAKKHNVHILAGSFYEAIAGKKKVYNTSCLIGPSGKIKASYRKINLFRASLKGQKVDEAQNFAAGKKGVAVEIGKFQVGLSICYDLRFPQLYRQYAQAGASVLCAPSAFTFKTGKLHWELLVRARAAENMCYMIAPNQIGTDSRGIRYFGNSMIVDPFGHIISRASIFEEIILYADLDLNEISKARRLLPNVLNKK